MNENKIEMIKKRLKEVLPQLGQDQLENTAKIIYATSLSVADKIGKKTLHNTSKKLWKKQ